MESQRRIDLITHAERADRDQVLALMDELTRPMTTRELEKELVRYYSRGKAKEICKALGFFRVVMLRPHAGAPEKPAWANHGDGTTGAPPARIGGSAGSR